MYDNVATLPLILLVTYMRVDCFVICTCLIFAYLCKCLLPYSECLGVILGSFFYGYITTQLLGGWLSQRFGGKRIFGYGILCTAVVSLFSPLAVNTNVWLLVTLRILEGIGEVTYV